MEENQEYVRETSARNQYLATIVVNLINIAWGLTSGWSSPNIILLTSDDSPIGKITTDELSWITSLLYVGGLIGNISFGFVAKMFGRKKPLICITIPAIIGWLLLCFAQNIYYLYGFRLLSGFVGGSTSLLIPIFLSEIADNRIRGALQSSMGPTFNIGMLTAYILGSFFEFYVTGVVAIALIILFAVLMFSIPETPSFLLKQNQISEAENSIRFYKNIDIQDNNLLQFEMKALENMIAEMDTSSKRSIGWSDFQSPQARKALTIGIALIGLNQFSGFFVLMAYSGKMFQESGSNLSPNMSTIVVGIIFLIGSLVGMYFIERTGRKLLYYVSAFGTAVGLITLGVYMMLKSWNYPVQSVNWIPLVSFSFTIFLAVLEIHTPFAIIAEVLPEKLKEFGISFCLVLLFVFGIITMKGLPYMIIALSFHGNMFLFAGVCIAGALFIWFYIPETKGKSYEQIMQSLQ